MTRRRSLRTRSRLHRLRRQACAAQRAGDAQAVADLVWQIQQLRHPTSTKAPTCR